MSAMRPDDWVILAASGVLTCGIFVLILAALAHARRTHRPLPRFSKARLVLLTLGLLSLFVGFAVPTHSVLPEMISHVLLAFAAAPLLLLGVPRAALLPLFSHPHLRRLAWALTQPPRAVTMFVLAISVCYLPRLLNVALQNASLRFLEGAVVTATALLFWWPVIEPWPAWPAEFAEMGKLLYLFIGSTALKVPGFILAIVPHTLYILPSDARPLFGLKPLADQQLAGWLMVLAGTFVLFAAATVVCFQLFHEPRKSSGVRIRDHAGH
ncbi:MAG: cytochrome c oxidase assembly protein [Chloroflexi bacterium]|nr:cytochrome c oxidase assembly protein [Chloroflexota bacterium]